MRVCALHLVLQSNCQQPHTTAHLLEIMATRCAKRHVLMLSSMCCASGATAATMTVRVLPPAA